MLGYETEEQTKLPNRRMAVTFNYWESWEAAYAHALMMLGNPKTISVFVSNRHNRADSICLVNEDA